MPVFYLILAKVKNKTIKNTPKDTRRFLCEIFNGNEIISKVNHYMSY